MKISVVIPAYNIVECLHFCVDSVLRQQTNCEVEVILVDDGSTDGTADICDTCVRMRGVKVVHKANGGLSSARNVGIDVATGDFVMFLDGDDYLAVGAIDCLVQIIKNAEAPFDFIQYRYVEVEDYSKEAPQYRCTTDVTVVSDKYEIFRRKLQLGGIGASACTKLIRRSALETVRFKEGIIHEDEQFTARLIDNIQDGVIYIDAKLYCYVMRQGSIIKSEFKKKKLDLVSVLEEQISILARNGYEDLANTVRSRLFVGLNLLYAGARNVKDKDSEQYISSKAAALAREGKMNLSHKFDIMARGLKHHLPMLQCYYIFKKLRNG